jgi:hypothetical protein
MTTSIDLSIDELLLLEENQYHMSNLVLANIKPIGVSETDRSNLFLICLFRLSGRLDNRQISNHPYKEIKFVNLWHHR